MNKKNDSDKLQKDTVTNADDTNTPTGVGYTYEEVIISDADDDYNPTSSSNTSSAYSNFDDEDYSVINNSDTFDTKDMDDSDTPQNSDQDSHRDNEGHKFSDKK